MESDFDIVHWDRFFALYERGELLCVTVYKKGAQAVKRRIEDLKDQIGKAQLEGTPLAEPPKGEPQSQDQEEADHVE